MHCLKSVLKIQENIQAGVNLKGTGNSRLSFIAWSFTLLKPILTILAAIILANKKPYAKRF
jgi:hypothetical protein